jgi:hypothetical protein
VSGGNQLQPAGGASFYAPISSTIHFWGAAEKALLSTSNILISAIACGPTRGSEEAVDTIKIRKILGRDIERLFLLVSDKSNQTIGVVKGLDRFRHNLYIGRGLNSVRIKN